MDWLSNASLLGVFWPPTPAPVKSRPTLVEDGINPHFNTQFAIVFRHPNSIRFGKMLRALSSPDFKYASAKMLLTCGRLELSMHPASRSFTKKDLS